MSKIAQQYIYVVLSLVKTLCVHHVAIVIRLTNEISHRIQTLLKMVTNIFKLCFKSSILLKLCLMQRFLSLPKVYQKLKFNGLNILLARLLSSMVPSMHYYFHFVVAPPAGKADVFSCFSGNKKKQPSNYNSNNTTGTLG